MAILSDGLELFVNGPAVHIGHCLGDVDFAIKIKLGYPSLLCFIL